MASKEIAITVDVEVTVSPMGMKPTMMGRLWLALAILAGRPVVVDFQTLVHSAVRS